MVIADGKVFATVAVKDLEVGKKFYGETLGLKSIDENPGGVTYECGGGRLFVYASPTGGTGQATAASWEVADVEAAVKELVESGVAFEKYDMPGVEWDGNIALMGLMKAAWFKDPDGNILMLGNDGK